MSASGGRGGGGSGMQCLNVAGTMTKCPLMEGVCLRKVFVRGGLADVSFT